MSLETDASDRIVIAAAEAATKKALTEGLDTGEAAVMTAEQYAPAVAPALAANAIKATAAGIVQGLRAVPPRLAIYSAFELPDASGNVGAMVYCWNGANGQPCIAFSSGLSWLRCDTLNPVSPV